MNAELIVLGTFALILVFVAIYALILPALTRRDLLFGVTVAPETRSTPAARAIVLRYRLITLALTVIGLAALGAIWTLLVPETAIVVVSFAGIGIVLLAGLPYLWAHFATRRLVRTQPAAAPVPDQERPSAELRPRHYGDYVPWVWELLPLLIIGATVAYLIVTYPSLPQTYPVHFGADGQPNGYATKSIAGYFSLVWTQLSLYALLTLISALVVSSRALPGEAEQRFRRVWLRFLYVLKVCILALTGAIAVGISSAAVSGVGPSPALFVVPTAFVALLLVVTLVLSLRTGQGGARLSPQAPATDRTSDRYWILGSIYVNRSDPSVFVERRFGVGWTLNFGNPRSLLFIAALVAMVLGTVVISIMTSRR